MASNNDLDDFFKKKDRKSNKSKKPTTNSILTNNEELLKQLVIVTSATQAFKENPVSDDEDDEHQVVINDNAPITTGYVEDTHKHSKTKVHDKNKHTNEQQINLSSKFDGQQQEQDVWEEFEDSNSKYKEFRLKLTGGKDGEQFNNDYDDDENNPDNNDNHDDVSGEREQQKDRPVWKTNAIKKEEDEQQQQQEPVVEKKIEESKPASTSVYRPPQLRSGSSVTVVGGVNSRITKKEKPNLASTDEFPTLGATVNKK